MGFQQQQFDNVLYSQARRNLTPKESMQKLVNNALLLDARTRSRISNNTKANLILSAAIFAYPVYYMLKGMFSGVWTELHQQDKVTLMFSNLGRPLRLVYRPEIYLRDQSAEFIELERQNIEKARNGEQVDATSPLVLWT